MDSLQDIGNGKSKIEHYAIIGGGIAGIILLLVMVFRSNSGNASSGSTGSTGTTQTDTTGLAALMQQMSTQLTTATTAAATAVTQLVNGTFDANPTMDKSSTLSNTFTGSSGSGGGGFNLGLTIPGMGGGSIGYTSGKNTTSYTDSVTQSIKDTFSGGLHGENLSDNQQNNIIGFAEQVLNQQPTYTAGVNSGVSVHV